MRWIYTLAALLAFGMVADTSLARGGKRANKVLQQLDLDKAQKKEFKELRQGFRGQLDGLTQELDAEQKKLHELMKSNASDSQIISQHDKCADLKEKRAKLRLEMMLKIRSKLTAEQQKKFAASLPEEPMGKRGKRRHKWGRDK